MVYAMSQAGSLQRAKHATRRRGHSVDSRAPWDAVLRSRALGPVAIAALCTGCMIESTKLPPTGAYPDPERRPSVVRERMRGTPQAHLATTERTIDIEASVPWMCRATTVTPNVADQTTERTLTPGGWMGQITLGATAGAFIAGGAYLLSNPCAVAGDAPCVDQVKAGSSEAGTASLALGGILTSILLVSSLSTIDSTNRVAAPATRAAGPWRVCGSEPAAGARVEVWFPNGFGVGGNADARGAAHLQLSFVPANDTFLRSSVAKVRVAGGEVGEVSFRNTELYRRSVEAAKGRAGEPQLDPAPELARAP